MEPPMKRSRNDTPWSSWISTKPSAAILVFNVPPMYSNADLFGLFLRYGKLKCTEKLPDGGTAIIEYEDISCAMNIVTTARSTPFFVGTSRAQLEYCCHALLESESAKNLSKVLHFHIANAVYPINVEIMQAICANKATPSRIMIGPKKPDNQIDALIEFENNMDALSVLEWLNGNDIYSGCCTLTISFSSLPLIDVPRNCETMWDYTNPALIAAATANNNKGGILGDHPKNALGPGSNVPSMNAQAAAAIYSGQMSLPTSSWCPPVGGLSQSFGQALNNLPAALMSSNNLAMNAAMGGMDQRATSIPISSPAEVAHLFQPLPGCVIFFNNLAVDIFNCDRLFNLACLYGNVAKVKFLKSRPGVALVQMGTADQAKSMLNYIDGIALFGKTISLNLCKQNEIVEKGNVQNMSDNTPYFKNFMTSPNNRFRTPGTANRGRVLPPTATVHFFNCPPKLDEANLKAILLECKTKEPSKIAVFPVKPGQKASMGLIEWENSQDAVEALILANNSELKDPDAKHPFHMKLAFSNKPIQLRGGGAGPNNESSTGIFNNGNGKLAEKEEEMASNY